MSYSSVGEVLAFTRYLLGGQTTFNTTTQPTATEVQKFIERASNVLDVALSGQGITTPVNVATARGACDDWVTARAAEYVELTQRGAGYSDAEGNRHSAFRNMHKAAADFAKENKLGFVRLGVTAGHGLSEGLQFTGQTAQADRADPDDTSLEQPMFKRNLFNNPEAGASEEDDE